ncbi:FAD-binding oxidoreductase [Brachybacterium saurashtrense]|uniref:FAD-binding protein n=1 Tax=Brachybacterium saurashtrense TaxID=556288 RepID=A0A345YKB8_9MICO|nr:FAD-linked oxidase C-terminal domain-containing protein [Brachybacterium saurashtrense]AXK44370.1 FAD-binding protein [Brachybacterium saurashtrense]RRR21312.1 FAD-binding protein [Brachybacterium saurashtrense]RRR22981.1 FAD-binding protein [Brachybacterium saurashtrense]
MSTTAPPHPVPSLADLAARLREEIGEEAVSETPAPQYAGDRAVRAAEGTGFVLALPRDTAGVQTTLRLAHETGTPVVPRGAGSGLSGGAVPTDGALVLGLERLTAIREIDVLDEVAVVEAGVVTADLSTALAPLGFFYAPDPASARLSTIGGNIATNAGGLHCAKYGVTRESVLALEAVLADGTLLTTGHRSLKGVTGLDLTQLLIGSEGTLAVITAATVRIRPLPVARRTVVARFDSAGSAAAGVNAISRSPVRPAATELLDGATLADIEAHTGSALADGDSALLLIELDGYGIEEQSADLVAVLTAAGAEMRLVPDEAEAEHLWELRRSGRGSGAGGHRLGEDIAVPKSRLAEIFTALSEIGDRHGVATSAVAHAGDGNLHPSLALPSAEGEAPGPLPPAILAAADELVRTALDLGGTVSGEHGIGTAKREWLDLELSPTSRGLQQRLKAAFDPHQLLNPGKAL